MSFGMKLLAVLTLVPAMLCGTNTASAQSGTFAYDRCGTLHGGIQCLTWDDANFQTWTLVGNTNQVPLNQEVRISGTATFGSDPNCAAAVGFIENFVILSCSDVGTDFCRGDGGDQMGCTDCPCGNNAPPGSDGGCINEAGSSAVLTASGSASVGAQDLCFDLMGANPSSFAVLTSGIAQAPANPANPCFAQNPGSGITSTTLDGLRCVVQGVLRHGTRAIDTNGDVGISNNGWGNCSPNFPNGAAFNAGTTRHFQAIYRELQSAVCQTGQNTTQGVSVSFTL